MEQLKKCPFCGGEAILSHANLDWFVRCNRCFCKTRTFKSQKSAILTWNNRKPMERIVERLEQQERQYNRRAKEFLTLGEKVYHEKHYAKACSYDHAIKIVKEEMG